MTPLLSVRHLTKHFPVASRKLGKKPVLRAVEDVSFEIARGETLSLVGESGCGKSTLGRLILRLVDPTSGEIWLDGQRIDTLTGAALRQVRRRVQAVFQDPMASLDPRMRVRDIVAEPLENFRLASKSSDIDDRVATLMRQVQLPADAMRRYPHEFSGGQRQRIGIARAIASKPDLIICDEAVSALDVSVKAQIIHLLGDLQDELGLSLLFISHDLAAVEQLTHRVAVMYLGSMVEIADRVSLFSAPAHPYTQALMSSVPVPDVDVPRSRVALQGDLPSPINPPPGCRFHTRCRFAFDRCRVEPPLMRPRNPQRTQVAACHLDTMTTPMMAPLEPAAVG